MAKLKGSFSPTEQCLLEQYVKSPWCSVEELAVTMNRTKLSIQKFVDSNVKVETVQAETPSVELPSIKTKDLFARKPGITIMTPTASEAIDDIKKATVYNHKNKSYIYKPDGK